MTGAYRDTIATPIVPAFWIAIAAMVAAVEHREVDFARPQSERQHQLTETELQGYRLWW